MQLELLGAAPGDRVLVAAPETAEVATALRGLGLVPAALDTEKLEVHKAALLVDPRPAEPERAAAVLTEIRRRLRLRGRLLLSWSSTAPSPDLLRAWLIALFGASFTVLTEAGDSLLARREEFHVRGYRVGDEAGILELFPRCFHAPRSLERWQWEYRANPNGSLAISQAFTAEGRLVCHYAAYPVEICSPANPAGIRSLALQVGDTMSAPEYRLVGRGPTSLLGRTARHFYARFCEGRVAFNYGFNTGNIQRFSVLFMRARRVESVPFHVRDPWPAPPPPTRQLAARLRGVRMRRIERFDQRFDELFARATPLYGVLVARDARYLNWRYVDCPDVRYFAYALERRGWLAGWIVLRHKGETVQWVDALFDPAASRDLDLLLRSALAAPEHQGRQRVEAWLTPRPAWWATAVAGLGFAARPEPNDLALMVVPFLQETAEADLRTSFYYTLGDSDLA